MEIYDRIARKVAGHAFERVVKKKDTTHNLLVVVTEAICCMIL